MRKIFTILTLSLIALTMYYLKHVENQTHVYITTVLKYHYVVETMKASIHIPIFISSNKTALTDATQIDRIKIKNDTIMLDLILIDITLSHQETYLDTTYDLYYYQLTVPRLNQHVFIDDASIVLSMVDGIEHEFLIGALEIMMFESSVERAWEDIYAKRDDDLLSIESLYVVSQTLLDLMISPHVKSHMTLDGQTYRVHLEDHAWLYWDIPLIIKEDNQSEMIIGMHWITSKRILSQTEGYHVTYDMYRNESRQTL